MRRCARAQRVSMAKGVRGEFALVRFFPLRIAYQHRLDYAGASRYPPPELAPHEGSVPSYSYSNFMNFQWRAG